MMFLEYAVWGAWAPVLGVYLAKTLGFTGDQIGTIYLALPLACAISPFLGGQVADRWVPTQYFLAVSHLLCGVAFLFMATQGTYGPFLWTMAVASLIYAPTLALTNSLAFHHMEDVDKEFGGIRVWGTIGWIVASWGLTFWRVGVQRGWMPEVGQGDLLYLAGAFAIILGLFCFFLPHTPPAKEAKSPWAFIEAVSMLKNKNFLVFMIISFIVATELQFYYVPTSAFLVDLGVPEAQVPGWMTLAQIAEIFTMAFALGYYLPRLGYRKSLAIGVIAWPIRYLVFVVGKPLWLVIASLTLHGICYVFFFTVGMVYVDSVAPRDIRASAQSLFAVVVLGIGSAIGSKFVGLVWDYFSQHGPAGEILSTDWRLLYLVPCGLTIACAAAFLMFFREEMPTEEKPAAEEAVQPQ